MQLIRKKMVESAKASIKKRASNSEIYGKMQEVFAEMDRGHSVSYSCNENCAICYIQHIIFRLR